MREKMIGTVHKYIHSKQASETSHGGVPVRLSRHMFFLLSHVNKYIHLQPLFFDSSLPPFLHSLSMYTYP